MSVDMDSSPGSVELGSMVSVLLVFGGTGLSWGVWGAFFFEFLTISFLWIGVLESESESEEDDEEEDEESDDDRKGR